MPPRLTDLFNQLSTELASAYRIERELGGGGMSRVFVAEETRLGRQVVIKVLPPDASAGIPTDRFEREIRLAASLQHPNIVPVLSAGSAAGLVYYVMPYVTGESLAARIARGGALPVEETVRILREVADALAYAHGRGVVHRDIKPDNILLTGRHALVTDFGVAKAVSAATGAGSSTTLTEAGFTLGTPAYMAPEQATADPLLDHRADLYAVGVMGYEMLAGRTPFTAATPQGMAAAHVAVVPEPVDRYRSGIPAALAALVMRCLEKHPADRPQTAEALLAGLEATPAPAGAPAPGSVLPAGRIVALAIAVALAVTAAAFAVSRVAGFPDWVWIGALVLTLAALPLLLHTGRLERRRAAARATGSFHASGEHLHHRIFTWRRALVGGAFALGALVLLAGAWSVSRRFGIGPAATLLSAGTLDERDRLVLADFVNRTADPTLGATVTEALRVDLGQSRVVRLVDSRQVAAALQRIGAPADTAVEEALAREVALREGAKAVVAGEVAPLGSGYVLTARIVTADSGTTMTPVRVTAGDQGALIDAVNRLSSELRARIGESLRSIRGSEPLARVTTGSLPALRRYTEARRAFSAGDYEKSRELLYRAIEIDSGFATAWRSLAAVQFNLGAPVAQRLDATRRAFAHRDRLPPLERHLTEAHYYSEAVDDKPRAIAAYEAALEIDPENLGAVNNLIVVYNRLGEFEKSEAMSRQAIAAGGPANLFINLMAALVAQEEWAAADSFVAMADTMAPPSHSAPDQMRLFAAAARRDFARVDTLAGAYLQDPGQRPMPRHRLLHERSVARAMQGRLAEAENDIAEVRRLGLEDGDLDRAATAPLTRVLHAALRGGPHEARAELARALDDAPYPDLADSLRPHRALGHAYAVSGDPAGVERARRGWEQARPADLRLDWELKLWDAWEAEAAGRWREAAVAYGDVHEMVNCWPCGAFSAAHAWHRAGAADSAIAWYRIGVDRPATSEGAGDWILYPVALRSLGVLYDERGDRANAMEYYRRFIELWRHADPELQPMVQDARERMARLVAEPQGA